MSLPDPKVGMVINYSYLWNSQAKTGQEEGLKDRPCVIIATKTENDSRIAIVAPITHSPTEKSDGVEIPPQTKARLGLDEQRSWVSSKEVNKFDWDNSPDLKPIPNRPGEFSYGTMPQNLMADTRDQIRENVQDRQFSTVKRDSVEPEGRPSSARKSLSDYRRGDDESRQKPNEKPKGERLIDQYSRSSGRDDGSDR